jgi:hypothetical protein
MFHGVDRDTFSFSINFWATDHMEQGSCCSCCSCSEYIKMFITSSRKVPLFKRACCWRWCYTESDNTGTSFSKSHFNIIFYLRRPSCRLFFFSSCVRNVTPVRICHRARACYMRPPVIPYFIIPAFLIILKWMLKKYNGEAWIIFILLRIWNSDGLLCVRRRSCWLSWRPSASELFFYRISFFL